MIGMLTWVVNEDDDDGGDGDDDVEGVRSRSIGALFAHCARHRCVLTIVIIIIIIPLPATAAVLLRML